MFSTNEQLISVAEYHERSFDQSIVLEAMTFGSMPQAPPPYVAVHEVNLQSSSQPPKSAAPPPFTAEQPSKRQLTTREGAYPDDGARP